MSMFAYLSKKIAIPNKVQLRSIAWNTEEGYIACGGEDGLLKVLRLETKPGGKPGARGIAAPSSLSINQPLEGHERAVINIAWNPTAQKLTTSDENGLIIVWMLHRGLWFEEMINNRNKSFVKDLQWNAEGKFICIAYADGAVIVGSVAGSREWGKTLQHNLERVQWSPDSKYILFATAEGTLEVYNSRGDHLTGVELQPEDPAPGTGGRGGSVALAASVAAAGAAGGSAVGGGVKIVALDWYNGLEGFEDASLPTLAVGFENGRLQLMCGHDDTSPLLVDTGMKLTTAKWNPQGTVLAVAGMNTSGGGVGTPYVQFYDSRGRHLRNLKLPGSGVRRLTWEGTGLRLAMAVDSSIYFANVRPPYKWASLGGGLEVAETAGALVGATGTSAAAAAASASGSFVPLTVVYAFTRPDRSDGGQALVFWNTATGDKSIQMVPGVEAIQGAGDRALVVMRTTDGDEAAASGGLASGLGVASRGTGRFAAYVFDSAGKPLHSKFLDVDPAFTAMTQQHVIIASDEQVVVWQYRSRVRRMAGVSVAAGLRQVQGKLRTFHIDDDLAVDGRKPAGSAPSTAGTGAAASSGGGLGLGPATTDPITCVAASAKILLVGRASGSVMRYTLPHLVNDAKYMLRGRPAQMAINCASTMFGVIDWRANLSFFDMSARDRDATTGKEVEGKQLARDLKDTWAVQWAVDSPTVCAAMEKTKLLVIDDMDMEKPPAQVNSGFIAYVDTTCVRCVMMDEVVAARDEPSSVAVVEFETAALRRVTALIAGKTDAEEEGGEEGEGAVAAPASAPAPGRDGDAKQPAGEADAGSLEAAVDYVKDHPHPRLWRLVADAAMQRLDFVTAERALAACSDYAGIQMVKRLRRLPDPDKQRAEVAAFFRRFGEAEHIYLEADRPDLAVDMRARLGDWHRVLFLLGSPDPTAGKAGGSGLAGQEDEVGAVVPRGVARGISGRDRSAAHAHERLGEALAEIHEWAAAVPHFVLAKSSARLAECLFRVEDYGGLVRLVKGLPAGDPLLPDLADKLQAAGLTRQASEAWVAAGDAKAAIDCCVLQNEWATAVELAEEHGYPQIEGLFGRYAEHLLCTGDAIAAVELYRKAKKETEAAKLLARLGEEALGAADDPEAAAAAATAASASASASAGEAKAGEAAASAGDRAARMRALTGAAVTLSASADPARAKKLFVLAALEVERFKQRTLDLKSISAATLTAGSSKTAGSAATAATLNTLLAQDAATATATRAGTTTTRESKRVARTLDQAWRAAEAVHFWMLAQDQLHSRRAAEAMQSAMRATLFEDVLPSRATYSLLALSAVMAGYMGVASRAFIRLESLPEEEADDAARDAFKGLAYTIYSTARPVDRATAKVACPKCSAGLSPWGPLCMACGTTFEACVATGEPIRTQPYYRCSQCRHKMLLEVAAGRKSCALCHLAVSDEQIQQRRHHAGASAAAGTAAGLAQAAAGYSSAFPL